MTLLRTALFATVLLLSACSTAAFKRQITSDPPGADVYVESLSGNPDRQYLGKTPLEINFFTSFRVGTSKLIFERDGQQKWAFISDSDRTNPHVVFDRPFSRQPTPHKISPVSDEELFEAALLESRKKILELLYVVSMTNDVRVTDRAFRNTEGITVNVYVALISDAAREAFAAQKLQRNAYPAFKRVYEDALTSRGFSKVYVQINTNPFASR